MRTMSRFSGEGDPGRHEQLGVGLPLAPGDSVITRLSRIRASHRGKPVLVEEDIILAAANDNNDSHSKHSQSVENADKLLVRNALSLKLHFPSLLETLTVENCLTIALVLRGKHCIASVRETSMGRVSVSIFYPRPRRRNDHPNRKSSSKVSVFTPHSIGGSSQRPLLINRSTAPRW